MAKGIGGKIGRSARKPSHKSYNSEHRRERNKIKRVLQSSGPDEAKKYAELNGLRMK